MSKRKHIPEIRGNRFLILAIIFFGLFLISLGLVWASSGYANLSAWLSFFTLLAICASLYWLSWRILKSDQPPHWLLLLTIGAALFRLALGVIWFLLLPAGGYDTEVQQAGYVMEDAYNRDVSAWDLAESGQPLVIAFQGFSSTDQYGGLLFLSAAIYRYLGTEFHTPLLMVVASAAVSGLAVAFTWAFSRRIWGKQVATLAAWGLALYPEAVLLGSSQMREAFTVFLLPLALYSLLMARERANLGNLFLVAIPIVVSIPLTWAFTPSLILILLLAHLSLDGWRLLRSVKTWIVLGIGLALLLATILFFVDVQDLWLVQSAKWQTYVSANASGWVARQFGRLPVFGQVPFLVIYGIFRPILPAALVDTGPVIWTAIGVWRALGWTVLLAMLIFASYLALKRKEWSQIPGALLFSNWVVSFAASYRGGGDLWDSPRYRSAYAAIQVALAAWAWVRYRETGDPWLRRAIGGTLLMVVWFIPWYLRRYTAIDWPISELYQVIGLGLVSAILFAFWDWLHNQKIR